MNIVFKNPRSLHNRSVMLAINKNTNSIIFWKRHMVYETL